MTNETLPTKPEGMTDAAWELAGYIEWAFSLANDNTLDGQQDDRMFGWIPSTFDGTPVQIGAWISSDKADGSRDVAPWLILITEDIIDRLRPPGMSDRSNTETKELDDGTQSQKQDPS